MNVREENPHWGTKNEINFLKQLGESCSLPKRIALLVIYLDTMKNRVHWGERVSKDRVEAAGRKLLLALRTGAIV